jgi:hypothetical protein
MEGSCCECCPDFESDRAIDEPYSKIAHRHCLPDRQPPHRWDTEQLSPSTLRWHGAVKEQSRLQLTVPEDRLPALSGLAVQMQTLHQDTYLAGLYQSSIFVDLYSTSRTVLHSVLRGD